MSVFLYLKMTNIKGESQDSEHDEWMTLDSVESGVQRSLSAAFGGQTTNARGSASHAPFRVTKYPDSATPALLLHACTGRVIAEAKLDVIRSDAERVPLLRYTFQNAVIVDYQTNIDTSGHTTRVIEHFAFQYTEIKVEYTKLSDDGGAGTTTQSAWSVTENRPV